MSPSSWVRLRLHMIEHSIYLIFTAVIVFYSILAIEYFVRHHLNAPLYEKSKETGVQVREEFAFTGKLRLMFYTLLFTTTVLFIR